jgi:pilus assembly protein Flp/PilA
LLKPWLRAGWHYRAMKSDTNRNSGRAGESEMNRAEKLLWNYVDDNSAATAIEYGLIASIISIAIVIAATQIGVSLQQIFGSVSF